MAGDGEAGGGPGLTDSIRLSLVGSGHVWQRCSAVADALAQYIPQARRAAPEEPGDGLEMHDDESNGWCAAHTE